MESCVLDPQRECLGLTKTALLEKQLVEHREHSRKDHAEMFDRIRLLEIAQAETKTQYGQIMESVVDKVLLAVIAAIMAYIMTQIGF